MAVNSFSDLTHEEFMHKYNTYRAPLIRENSNHDNGANDQFVTSSQNEIQQNEIDDETRLYSYFVKKIVNSTHEEILTKYVADVIKTPSKTNTTFLPSSIDWRQKVNLQFLSVRQAMLILILYS